MASSLGLQRCLRSIPFVLSSHTRTFFNAPNFLPSSSPSDSSDTPEQSYHERKILPYSRKQLYQVVADFESYDKFLPFCTACRVLKSRPIDPEDGRFVREKKEVELTVGFLSFTESYISEVTCNPYESVEAVASSSTQLFKKLTTTWRFQPANQTSPHLTATSAPSLSPLDMDNSAKTEDNGPTLISIDLAYAFANPLYAGVSAMFFGQVSQMMVEAFEKRCLQVYGPGKK